MYDFSVLFVYLVSVLCCVLAIRYRWTLIMLPLLWLHYLVVLRVPTEVLRVQNFVEYIPQQIIDGFEHETGVKIIYDVIPDADGSVLDFQLLMNSSRHDVVLLSLHKARALFELGLLRPVVSDTARDSGVVRTPADAGSTLLDSEVGRRLCLAMLSAGVSKEHCDALRSLYNARAVVGLSASNTPESSITTIPYNVEPHLIYSDQGQMFCIPYVCGALGVAYDAERVRMALGCLPEDPLDLVFDLEVVRRLHDAGVVFSIADAPLEIIPCLAMYMGYELRNYNPSDLKDVYTHLNALRRYYDKIHLTLYMRDIDSNRADVVLGWSTFLQAAVQKNSRFVFADPTRHQITWMDVFCIPSNAKNYKNALRFVEFVRRPHNVEVIRSQYCGNRTYQPGVNYAALSIDQIHEILRFWQLFKFGIA